MDERAEGTQGISQEILPQNMAVWCYDLDFKCPPKTHVFKAWSLVQQCSEAGDSIMRTLTL
jgi:hypothetical protein